MSERLQESIEVHADVETTKRFINETIEGRPEIGLVLQDHHWIGNVMHASGMMGSGTLTVTDGSVTVDIELSMFGSAVRSKINEALHDLFKPLQD